jgi:diadenosine tetraphosphate (Ap4A) HIT family hydrolase
MPQIPEDVLQHIGMVAKGVSHAQLRALKAQGTNIFVANGVTAGQRAQHFMMHVIPRMDGDQLAFALPERAMSAADIAKAQVILKKALAKALGLKVPDEPESKAESQTPKKEKKKAAPKEELKKKSPEAQEKPADEEEEPEEKSAKKEADKKIPVQKQKAAPKKGANLDEIARLLTGGK